MKRPGQAIGVWAFEGRRRFFIGAATLLLALENISSVHADVIFTDFAANNVYSGGVAYEIGSSSNYADADSFTVGAGTSYTLDAITIALSDLNDHGNMANVSLMTDSGGLPGTVLDSFTTPALPNFGTNNDPVVLNAVNTDMLQAGATYWVAVTASTAKSIEWNFNYVGDKGTIAQSTNGGSSWTSNAGQTLGAFSIEATPQQQSVVPEPSTFVLFSLGLLGCVTFRARAGALNLRRTWRDVAVRHLLSFYFARFSLAIRGDRATIRLVSGVARCESHCHLCDDAGNSLCR